ncbi:MAG: TIGR02281 family clan AA aspartic protease [Proteobacteria bacterium]|nr:TIGR02281 family clan AA aspartic protease [Pseudomonadota bacterium]
MSRSWIAGCGNFSLSLALLAWSISQAFATEVTLVGLIGAKAIVVIDGGAPRTLTPGQKTAEGVVLIATEKDAASFEIDGQKRSLPMGRAYSAAPREGRQNITLAADARGHFVTMGTINGGSVRFLVDTGATFVSLSASEARRLGISYLQGQRGQLQTANGLTGAYRIKLDTVRVGDIQINNVDAVVTESDTMGVTLLGMSFLNRMEMKRDGQSMTLTRRF